MTYSRVLVLKLFSCDAAYECCFLINNGTKIKAEQSLLGNSTAVTTMSIYAHEIQSAGAAASAALGEILETDLIKKAE